MELKEQVLELAYGQGMDYVGVASIDRFKNAPQGHKPEDLLPSAKSVISIAMAIPEGVLESNNRAYQGLRHGIFPYTWFGYVKLNECLDHTGFLLTRLLEKRGYRTLPIPASVPRDERDLRGALSNRHAAVAAGLGGFGWNGLLLHPDVGPRIRCQSVITEAELAPDPLYQGPPLCQQCKKCIQSCPMEALHSEEKQELSMDGRTFSYAVLNKFRCRCGVSGFTKSTAGRADLNIPADGTMEEWLEIAKKDNVWNKIEREASMCGRCMVVCPVGRPLRERAVDS